MAGELGGLPAGAEVIDGFGAGDGCEPAAEGRLLTKAGQAAHGSEEDILKEVFGVGRRDAGEQDAVDHAGVALVEFAEGGAVTGAGTADQQSVTGGVDGQSHRGGHGISWRR